MPPTWPNPLPLPLVLRGLIFRVTHRSESTRANIVLLISAMQQKSWWAAILIAAYRKPLYNNDCNSWRRYATWLDLNGTLHCGIIVILTGLNGTTIWHAISLPTPLLLSPLLIPCIKILLQPHPSNKKMVIRAKIHTRLLSKGIHSEFYWSKLVQMEKCAV